MNTQNTAPAQDTNGNQLHAIATEASTYFVRGNGNLSSDAIWALRASLEKLTDSPELGPAVASLVMVAAHLDKTHGAKVAAEALLQIAVTATPALEAQTRKAQEAVQDRRKTLDGSTKADSKSAPRFGDRAPAGTTTVRSLKFPTKFV